MYVIQFAYVTWNDGLANFLINMLGPWDLFAVSFYWTVHSFNKCTTLCTLCSVRVCPDISKAWSLVQITQDVLCSLNIFQPLRSLAVNILMKGMEMDTFWSEFLSQSKCSTSSNKIVIKAELVHIALSHKIFLVDLVRLLLFSYTC